MEVLPDSIIFYASVPHEPHSFGAYGEVWTDGILAHIEIKLSQNEVRAVEHSATFPVAENRRNFCNRPFCNMKSGNYEFLSNEFLSNELWQHKFRQ